MSKSTSQIENDNTEEKLPFGYISSAIFLAFIVFIVYIAVSK